MANTAAHQKAEGRAPPVVAEYNEPRRGAVGLNESLAHDKQAAAEEAQNRAILRDKKQRIKDALAFAENRELDNKTVEELKAMLNDLGE